MTHNILEPGDGEGQEGGCEGLLGGGGVAEVPGVRSQGVSGASLHGAPAVAETVLGVVADVALHVEDEAAAETRLRPEVDHQAPVFPDAHPRRIQIP